MQEWMSFFIALLANVVATMETWLVFGVSVIGIIVAVFVLEVILRAVLYKA